MLTDVKFYIPIQIQPQPQPPPIDLKFHPVCEAVAQATYLLAGVSYWQTTTLGMCVGGLGNACSNGKYIAVEWVMRE